MTKIVIVLVFFVFAFSFWGCQQEPVQKTTMQKETSTVSITVKDPNEQGSVQGTQEHSGGSVGVVE